VSCGRGRGGWREALNGLQMTCDRSSPRPGAGMPADSTIGRGGSARRGTGQRRLYSKGRAGARKRGSAGRARTIGQQPYCAGQGGRTAARQGAGSADFGAPRRACYLGTKRLRWEGAGAARLPRHGGGRARSDAGGAHGRARCAGARPRQSANSRCLCSTRYNFKNLYTSAPSGE
jgi:hypothetical protein